MRSPVDDAGPVLDRGRIRVAGVYIYIERTLAPTRLLPLGTVPRPYGLASTALVHTDVAVAAVGVEEAIWLGFQAIDESRPAVVRIRAGVGRRFDAVSGEPWTEEDGARLTCPPDFALAGIRRPEGHRAFRAGQILTVLVDAPEPAVVVIHLVSPAVFTRLAGTTPEALNPEAAYRGQRLP
jgi:hypothetical protein